MNTWRRECKWCAHPRASGGSGVSLTHTVLRSSLTAMSTNAESCVTCGIFSAGVRSYLRNTSQWSSQAFDEVTIALNIPGPSNNVEIRLLNSPIRLSFFCSKKTQWLYENLPGLEVGREVPKTTSSDDSLSWAIEQINHCIQSHDKCGPDATVLPKRVIYVGSEAEPAVRLYESRHGEVDSYCCLSHCWGNREFLRTVHDNIESHKTFIDPDHLPLTFKDAIEYTRKLGIRYLWIDSLCIIQDSQEDWRQEAGKMASIFRQALLVLCATRSSDAYGGLYASFPSENEAYTIAIDTNNNSISSLGQIDDLETENHLGAIETVYARRALTHPPKLSHSKYLDEFAVLPTFRRGWIFQERFLSPRVLHFGPQELSFECLQSSTCQCTDHPASDKRFEFNSRSRVGNSLDTLSFQGLYFDHLLFHRDLTEPKAYYNFQIWLELGFNDLVLVWHRLVADYTKLELTYEKDLFPAIAGLARSMGMLSGRQVSRPNTPSSEAGYFAGIWVGRGSWSHDLLWHIKPAPTATSSEGDEEGKRLPAWMERPKEWRAPSWSWGSVKAPVEFLSTLGVRNNLLECECELVGISCVAAGPDRFGEIVAGLLRLKGWLISATVKHGLCKVHGGEPKPWNLLDLDLRNGHYVKNIWVDYGCEDLLAPSTEMDAADESKRVFCFWVGSIVERNTSMFLLLKRAGQTQVARVQAALTQAKQAPVELDHKDTYERFGLLEISASPNGVGGWDFMKRANETIITII